jgi:hypothetical protein
MYGSELAAVPVAQLAAGVLAIADKLIQLAQSEAQPDRR